MVSADCVTEVIVIDVGYQNPLY